MRFNYEVMSTNLFSLPDEKQNAILGRFLAVLSNLQKPLRILIVKEPLDVKIGNETRRMVVPRTYLGSNDPLEHLLDSLGYQYSVVLALPSRSVVSEGLRHLKIENGYARCFTLYSLPSSLGPAWIHSLVGFADMISVTLNPISHDQAVGHLNRYVSLVRTVATRSLRMAERASASEEVLAALTRQETALFEFWVVATVFGRDLRELKTASRTFLRNTNALLARFEATLSRQRKMFQEGWGKRLFVELGSCAILYPFVSADLLEVPNGVLVGINKGTGAPVIFDYAKRDNYNILLLATSGAGKSVTAKVLLTRLVAKYPDSLVFVIDPQGEYGRVASYLNIPQLSVTQKGLGLDPFKLFDSKDAAEILGDITGAKDTVRKEFRALATKATSVFELYSIASPAAKEYLKDLVEGPLSEVLVGTPSLSERTVLSLRGTYGQDESVAMLFFLALGKIWKKILETPPTVPKILLVDEGWMLFKMASAGKFIDSIARMGRKLNVIFVFVTQRPEDVIDNEYGRGVADNAGTKILMQNTEQASKKIAQSMSLSDREVEMLKTFSRGEALFLTKDYRLRVQITPSREELKMFSTTPMEM